MSQAAAPPIRVDMIADLICPWCYIGKLQLDTVLTIYAELRVDLHWRPFQLDPNVPPNGIDLQAYQQKLQNQAEVEAAQAKASVAARDYGLTIAWDKITRMPNTQNAHRLIRHGKLFGVEMKLVERLFRAYFCDGIDIGDRASLSALGEECGIDRASSEMLFARQDDLFAIEEEIAKTRLLVLPKLPCFVLDDDIVVPGDAPANVLVSALFRAQHMPPEAKDRLA